MAEKKYIIFEADIEVDKAIQSQKKLTDEIAKQREELRKLRESEDDNTEAIIKKEAEIRVLNKELTAQRNLTEKMIVANKASAGSIDQLSAELAAVTKQWNALSEEERENTAEGKELTKQKTELTKKLSELRQATGDSRMEVGKYKDTTVSLKLELRENIKALAQMKAAGEDNTEAYKQLLKTTGELQDTIADTREEVKRYASDTQTLDMAIGVFKGIGSAAQVAEGASALLGDENEQLTKSIQKMVALQSVMNGLQEIQNALQKESAAMMGLNTLKTKAMAAAQAIYTTAVGTSTGAMKVFRTALLATGIGAIIAGIALLVANWDKLTSSVKAGSKALDGSRIASDDLRESHNEHIEKLRDLEIELKVVTGALSEFEAELMRLNNTYDKEILDVENETEKQVAKATGFGSMLVNYLKGAGNAMLANATLSKELIEIAAQDAEKRTKIEERRGKEIELINAKHQKELEKQLGEEEAKRAESAIKANEQRIKLENDLKEAYLKSELAFFDEVEKIRQEIVKRDLERIENYNDNIFAEYEEQSNREAELEAKKAQRLVERLNTDFENEMAILEMNEATKFEAKKQRLDAQREIELANAELIGADTLLINEKYRQQDLELERMKVDAKLALASNFMGGISQLFDQGTAVGKAAAVADTLINTYRGAQAAFAQTPGGIGIKVAAAALSTAIGLKNVQKILATKKGSAGGGSASSSVASAPMANAVAPQIASSAIAGQTATSTAQTTSNSVAGQIQSTVAVVVDDVTAKQNQQLANSKLGTI